MCGIFGIIRSKPSNFDYSTFCTLGIANDLRGGDSCGIFIDGVVEYGVNDEKLFQDFFLRSEFLSNVKQSTIALGHCRKASVGAINIATAQPVVIQNENNETVFVVLHNGTIHNYEDLAKKYIPDVDIKGMTDSQVMARIFYYKGYDVLAEYNGSGVFFIVDYREAEPKVMFFKGASKKYYSDIDITEERPLYFCVDGDEMVFSSIPTYLFALRPNSTLYTPTNNVLGEFKDGKLIAIKKYDRSKMQQQKIVSIEASPRYLDYVTYNVTGGYYTCSARRINGQYFISDWGGVYTGKPAHLSTRECYFFNGIDLAEKKFYNFVTKAFKKSNKTIDDFTNDNILLIKYLSLSRLHVTNNITCFVDTPNHLIPFTGSFRSIGSTRVRTYRDGSFVCETYEPISQHTNDDVRDVNLKELKSLWKL